MKVKVKVWVTRSYLTLCKPMDYYSSPGSSVHGILQARTLEWVAIFFSRGSSQPRDWTSVSCVLWILHLQMGSLLLAPPGTRIKSEYTHTHTHTHTHLCCLLLSHVWLFCDPMDYSSPGSSVHGISQVRILEWVAISFSRGHIQFHWQIIDIQQCKFKMYCILFWVTCIIKWLLH